MPFHSQITLIKQDLRRNVCLSMYILLFSCVYPLNLYATSLFVTVCKRGKKVSKSFLSLELAICERGKLVKPSGILSISLWFRGIQNYQSYWGEFLSSLIQEQIMVKKGQKSIEMDMTADRVSI